MHQNQEKKKWRDQVLYFVDNADLWNCGDRRLGIFHVFCASQDNPGAMSCFVCWHANARHPTADAQIHNVTKVLKNSSASAVAKLFMVNVFTRAHLQ
jgi:hypothetical protein